MIHDVFISYSTKDQKVVSSLSAFLEQNGIRCFVAYRDIPKGIVWAQAVTEAIENCKLMVVVFSENFNSSKQVDREIEMCIEDGKTILTFKIENVEFKGVKKYFLKNLNWIDAFPEPEKSFEKLFDNIVRLIPEIGIKQKVDEQCFDKAQQPMGESSHSGRKKISYNKIFIPIICVVVVGIFLWVGIHYYKNKSLSSLEESKDVIITDTASNEPQSVLDTNILNTKIDVPMLKNNTPVVAPINPNKNVPVPQPSHYNEKVKINYTEPKTLISTSGETFEVDAGDIFEGEIEQGTGKIIQGKVKDAENKVKHLFILKRNQ